VLDVLTGVILVLVAVRVGSVTRRVVKSNDVRRRTWEIVRGIRPRHVLPVPFVLTAVFTAVWLLWSVPPLRWGWWTAIGGLGNPVTGGTERTSGTALEWLIPLVFLLLLLPALPLFADAEERRFRMGAEHWSTGRRIRRGIEFGLAHAIVGIPIGVALALSIGGWWFMYRYLRGVAAGGMSRGLLESTRAHTAYNGTLVVLFLIVLALEPFV
jgi:hypothetical protein